MSFLSALPHVELPPVSLAPYRSYADPALWLDLEALASSLRGLRVVHLNATATGGGVAEILTSLVPLLRALGLDAHWYVLPPNDAFFKITKRLHNWLQGRPGRMTEAHKRTYLGYLEEVAAAMRELRADVWVVHDPQPLPLRSLVPLEGAAIWRCHIDASSPNLAVSRYLLPWMQAYDRLVFSMPEFILPGLPLDRTVVEYPAIDPLTPKNRPLPLDVARAILRDLGLNPERPLVTQVSRFDPWKNPWQAVDAYRLARRELPGLQLALVGVFSARDDPEGPRIYRDVRRYAGRDPDVHFFTDPKQVAEREVNAFQTASTVVLQRSLREGFGLTVTEAMWKARPVIATPVGGIKVQIRHAENGFLVDTAEACAEHIVRLVRDPELARRVGEAARESVRQRFLVTRLLHDELTLYQGVAAGRLAA